MEEKLRIYTRPCIIPYLLILYMKKLRDSDQLKTSAFSCNTSVKLKHEFKVVTRVQVTNNMRMLSKFPMTRFLLQFGVISTCKFFENYKLYLP